MMKSVRPVGASGLSTLPGRHLPNLLGRGGCHKGFWVKPLRGKPSFLNRCVGELFRALAEKSLIGTGSTLIAVGVTLAREGQHKIGLAFVGCGVLLISLSAAMKYYSEKDKKLWREKVENKIEQLEWDTNE